MDANKRPRFFIDGTIPRLRLAASMAGRDPVAHGYPITPAGTSVMDAFKEFCGKYRRDPENRA